MKPKTKKQNLPDKVKSKPKTKTAEELTAAFLKTPAMVEHTKIIGTVNAQLDPGDTETVCLQIPKQFLTMLEFVERNNASDEGRKADPAAKVLGQMVLNELHDMLHWLVVAPAHFDRYRDLWNRFCDEQNTPQHKIAKPQDAAAQGGEGPF